jgi:hypothetical protein
VKTLLGGGAAAIKIGTTTALVASDGGCRGRDADRAEACERVPRARGGGREAGCSGADVSAATGIVVPQASLPGDAADELQRLGVLP